MNKDWDRVLSDTLDWTGKQWALLVCEFLNYNVPDISGWFLTAGPGMVGTEAWVFKEKCPNLEIIGYEPQIDRYNFLKDKFPGRLFNSAITSHDGIIQGWMGHKDGKSDFWLRADEINQKDYIEANVLSVTVDNILKDIEGPGVLWLDIEGSEMDALRGALISLMDRRFYAINVEINFKREDENHVEWYNIVELLRLFGYRAILSSCEGNVNPCAEAGMCLTEIKTDGHADILFVLSEDNSRLPVDYLKVYMKKD